jgi:hypothetical protein
VYGFVESLLLSRVVFALSVLSFLKIRLMSSVMKCPMCLKEHALDARDGQACGYNIFCSSCVAQLHMAPSKVNEYLTDKSRTWEMLNKGCCSDQA